MFPSPNLPVVGSTYTVDRYTFCRAELGEELVAQHYVKFKALKQIGSLRQKDCTCLFVALLSSSFPIELSTLYQIRLQTIDYSITLIRRHKL
jgi:hypothetical protein